LMDWCWQYGVLYRTKYVHNLTIHYKIIIL
jgi:hypothetical protein